MPDSFLSDAAGFSRLSYTRAGAGPTLILLHGFPENSGLWRRVVPLLQDHFTVLCPDLPGAGGSALPSEGELTVERMADAVLAIADNEGIHDFHLAGHSMGGYVALALAEKAPDRLRSLTLVHSSAAPDTEEKKAQRRKTISLLEKGGKDAFLREMIPGLFGPKTKETNAALLNEQKERAAALPAEAMIAFLGAMMARPDRRDVLRNAAWPVQFLLGEDDFIISAKDVLEQAALPARAGVAVYPDVGHMSMVEAPKRLAADLARLAVEEAAV